MPSTTNSFPGYSCGVVRLFNMRYAPLAGATSFPSGHVETQRPLEHVLERVGVALRGPQLQLGVTRHAQPDQVRVAARDHVDSRDDLRVAAVEPLGQPQHRGERLHRLAQAALE